MKSLPFVLAVVAGSTDVIGFIGLDGLFTAHITGNLVVLGARWFAGQPARIAHLIAVPVFIVVLAAAKLLGTMLERAAIPSLRPLLLLQLLLLAAFSAICLAAGPQARPNSAAMIVAGMLGVSAMAVQNALVRISLRGAPSTAVMTTNVTTFTVDVVEIALGDDPGRLGNARERARRTWPAILGFLLGCAFGALCEAILGLRSLALPTGCAAVALALGAFATRAADHRSERRPG